jgi:hypothetical protein
LQPFHANQTPSKRFIAFKWTGILPAIDIEETGETIGFYHFAYEDWSELKFKSKDSELAQALLDNGLKMSFKMEKEQILSSVVDYSHRLAPAIGHLSYKIFPRPKRDIPPTPLMGDLLQITVEIFTYMGQITRQMTEHPLSFSQKEG